MTKPATAETVLYAYDKCDTCRKAERALRAQGIAFTKIALFEVPPAAATFRRWMSASGLPVKRWINVAGESYRTLLAVRGKEAVAALDAEAFAELFAADGRLVKRPILEHDGVVLVGFDEQAYAGLTPAR